MELLHGRWSQEALTLKVAVYTDTSDTAHWQKVSTNRPADF